MSNPIDFLGRMFTTISPIKLFEQGTLSALASTSHEMLSKAAKGGMGELMTTSWRAIKGLAYTVDQSIGRATNNLKSGNPDIASGFRDYMSGYKLGQLRSDFTPGTLNFNRNVRIGAMAALGVGTASSLLLGSDNPISKAIGFAGSAAVNTAIGSALYKVNPYLGMGYGALGLINIMRPGDDHIGPF